jgi:hypothetical protein
LSNAFVVVLTGIILIAFRVSEWLAIRRGNRIKRSVLEKTNAAIEKHFATLARKRTQLAQQKWSEEIRYFMLDDVRPTLTREELDFFHENFAALAVAIERAIDNAIPERS